jgi:hypothetical protein
MRSKPRRRPIPAGPETSRILAYALRGVAKELARLLNRHLTRRRRALTQRGETGVSKRDVFRLLCRAFLRASLNPRGDASRAAKQRSALAFVLAAADVPSALAMSGIPREVRRARKRGRGR